MTEKKWEEFDSSTLLQSIPKQFQIGLRTCSLMLTCIDTFKNHLVIGTNAGLLYLVSLSSLTVSKLYLKASQHPISSLSSLSSSCDVVACGSSTGTISIFILERKPNPTDHQSETGGGGGVSNVKLPSRLNLPKLLTITDLHSTRVTSLSWNNNGTSLFTGDESGKVCLVTVHYETTTCTGKLLHKMDSLTVQLSCYHNLLAISCTNQCVIYNLENQSVVPIGKNYVRRYPGKFGCTFVPADTTFEPLFCTRYEQRLWAVNCDGSVQWTFINKDPCPSNNPSTSILNPTFGTLHFMAESNIASHAENNLCIFDLHNKSIIYHDVLQSDIIGISVLDRQIFILLCDFELICISKDKPVYYDKLLDKSNDKKDSGIDLSNFTLKMIPDPTKITSNLSKLGEELSQSFIRRSKDIFNKSSSKSMEEGFVISIPTEEKEFSNATSKNNINSDAEKSEGLPCSNITDEEILVVPKNNHAKSRRKKATETLITAGYEQKPTSEVLKYDEMENKLASELGNEIFPSGGGTSPQTKQTKEFNQKTSHKPESILDKGKVLLQDNIKLDEFAIKDGKFHKKDPLVGGHDGCSTNSETTAEAKETPAEPSSALFITAESKNLPGKWSKIIFFTNVETAVGYGASVAFHNNTNLFLPVGKCEYRNVSFGRKITGLLYHKQKQLLLVNLSGKLFKITDDNLASELVADGVKTACIDGFYLWVSKINGQVVVLTESSSVPPVQINTDILISKIVSHDGVVWALSDAGIVYYRLGSSLSATGIEWVPIKNGSSIVADIHLSGSGMGWKVDIFGRIFVMPFVRQHYPQGTDAKWWQVNFCEFLLVTGGKRLSLTSDKENLWLIEEGESVGYSHPIHSFKAYRWEVFAQEIFTSVYAEGCYGKYGALYCLSRFHNLYVINRKVGSVIPLSSPNDEKIVSVACRPQKLWVLTASGEVYSRSGLSVTHFIGSRWERIDQSRLKETRLIHISLGSEIAWGVDSHGNAYIRLGADNGSNSGHYYPWVLVKDAIGIHFKKISVGSLCHTVWAIDTESKLYAREAVYGDFPIGGAWVLLEGILASDVVISEDKVFVRTVNGQVFQRKGVNAIGGNYIGDSWLKLPTGLTKIAYLSTTTDGILYGLNEYGRIIKQEVLNLLDIQGPDVPTQVDDLDSDDYEII